MKKKGGQILMMTATGVKEVSGSGEFNDDEIADAMKLFWAGDDDNNSIGNDGMTNDIWCRIMSSMILFGTGWILLL